MEEHGDDSIKRIQDKTVVSDLQASVLRNDRRQERNGKFLPHKIVHPLKKEKR